MITLKYRVYGSDSSRTTANATIGEMMENAAEGLNGRAYDDGNYWVVELPNDCETMWRLVMQDIATREAKLLRTVS